MKKQDNKKSNIIEECYQKSIELLKNNSTKYGFLASSPQKKAVERNYLSIFGRDASICSLGAIASGNKDLIKTAKNSILTLGKNQADNGQLPNFVKPQDNNHVDFWYMDSIDSTLWWLIMLKFYDEYSGDKKLLKAQKKKIEKALNWLDCRKHVKDELLVQNEASDWADNFPRRGKVLYSNALWCRVLDYYNPKKVVSVKENFNRIFFPDQKLESFYKRIRPTIKLVQKKPINHYLSYINFLFWGEDVDVLGSSLAIMFNKSKYINGRVYKYLKVQKRLKDYPIPVLFNPIKPKSKEWARYMDRHKQNYPYQYQNGGIWPFAACFWAMALHSMGKKKEAKKELEKIAYSNSLKKWQFREWFHARTGKERGMKGQTWNAGAFLLAYHYINNNIKF